MIPVPNPPPGPGPATAPNFNHLARPYRWLEYLTFGPFLNRTRRHFLPQLANCRQALVLGDGDGRFTAALLQRNPAIHIHAVDGSQAMLDALFRRTQTYANRLTITRADIRHWSPSLASKRTPSQAAELGDLISTHFFLDCLTTQEVQALAVRLAPALASNALWVVSDFAVPTGLFGHFVAAPIVAALYRAFRLLTGLGPQSLPNHRAALAAAGWVLQAEKPRLCGLLISELWARRPSSDPGS